MDTPFDITQKPLSVAELEQGRETLKDRIAAGERRIHHDVVKLASLCGLILTASIVGNAYWGWLPEADYVSFVANAAISAVFAIVINFVFGGVVALAALWGGFIGATAVGAAGAIIFVSGTVGAAAGTAGFAAAEWFKRRQDRTDLDRATLSSFDDAPRETCLDIKNWLEDDTIHQYRDWVQTEGRLFTNGEVEAMREHWDSRAERQTQAKRAAAIDAACREVYVEKFG